MKVNSKAIEKWVWLLIYSGLLVSALGLSLLRKQVRWAWFLVGLGAAAVVAGVVLIVVRSRMKALS